MPKRPSLADMTTQDNRLASSLVSGFYNDTALEIHVSAHSQSILETTPEVTIHKIDSQPETLTSLLLTIQPDIVFSAKSGGSFEQQKEIIDSIIKAKVPRFVPCEWGQDSLSVKVQGRLPPSQERARTIAYLREQAGKHDALAWIAIATGCEIEHALISGNIGFDIEWQSATVHGTGDENFAASSSSWPGRVALAVIEHWTELENQYLYAPGLVTTANSILHQFREQTGQEWTLGHVDVEDTIHEAERRLDRGFPDASMFLMERSVLFDEKMDAVQPFIQQDAKGRLGLIGEDLEPIVMKVLHDFRHHGKGGCGCD